MNGTTPAQCSPSSQFPEMIAGWCYANCSQGFEPDEGRCWTTCTGGVPTDWPLMCGRDESALKSAATEMASSVLRALTTATMIVNQVQEHGVNTTTIKDTIDMFVKLSKPFAFAICSKRHFDTAPTPVVAAPSSATPPVTSSSAPSPMSVADSDGEVNGEADGDAGADGDTDGDADGETDGEAGGDELE